MNTCAFTLQTHKEGRGQGGGQTTDIHTHKHTVAKRSINLEMELLRYRLLITMDW